VVFLKKKHSLGGIIMPDEKIVGKTDLNVSKVVDSVKGVVVRDAAVNAALEQLSKLTAVQLREVFERIPINGLLEPWFIPRYEILREFVKANGLKPVAQERVPVRKEVFPGGLETDFHVHIDKDTYILDKTQLKQLDTTLVNTLKVSLKDVSSIKF
jgi:hypothetical protein